MKLGEEIIIVLFKVIKIKFKPFMMQHAAKAHPKSSCWSPKKRGVPGNCIGARAPSDPSEIRNQE